MARAGKYDFLSLYKDVQTAYRQKYSTDQVPPVLRLFYEVELETLADFLHVPNNECIAMDRAVKASQEDLYRQIGQLKYELQMAVQNHEDRENSLLGDLSHVNEDLRVTREKEQLLIEEKYALEEQLQKMYQSTSWKVTKPIRWFGNLLK